VRGDDPLRFLFLDSWTDEVAEGTGTTVGISSRARGLRERGHEVRSLGLPSGSTPRLVRRLLFNLHLKRPRGFEPDVVVGFDLDGFWRRPSSPPTPFVAELKGVAADEARYASGPDRAHLLLLAALERWSARRADLVVVPSYYSAREVGRLYGVAPDRIAVIPEAIELEPWEEERSPPSPGEPPVILSVARQYPRKNTATLLRAHRLLLSRIPQVRLKIVGQGPELVRLQRFAGELGTLERVAFSGALASHEEVRQEYGRAHCFCLPSLQEGFGIVYLEAMAAGLPVVAPDRGAPMEVLDGAALYADPESPPALARALERVLTDRALARRLARFGRDRVFAFESRAVTRRYEELLRSRFPRIGEAQPN
jgi:glycosyltransferase involved in cell wall biosynthesis